MLLVFMICSWQVADDADDYIYCEDKPLNLLMQADLTDTLFYTFFQMLSNLVSLTVHSSIMLGICK